MINTKTLHLADYPQFPIAFEQVNKTVDTLHKLEVRCEIPHAHRLWEYASAVQAYRDLNRPAFTGVVCDVGSGYSPLGPLLKGYYHCDVVEMDVDSEMSLKRAELGIIWKQGTVADLPKKAYDAVFCISVIEHIRRGSTELNSWGQLCDAVSPGGLLFITVDVVPDATKDYVYDNLRETKFTVADIRDRLLSLPLHHDMEHVGVPDYQYHGSYVFDYSFMRVCMRKRG